MFSAFFNCFKIPELRDKIFFTLLLLFIARVGANIPLPGVDPTPLQDFLAAQSGQGSAGILQIANMFTGGALLKGALFALGIMPYISASIIFQLLAAVMPSLARLQQEGEVGRQKLTQYTRYATVAICLVQAGLLVGTMLNPAQIVPNYDMATYGPIVLIGTLEFTITAIIFLTAGTILLMWIGEQITEKGIGNGVSILITVGILADLPSAASLTFQLFNAPLGDPARLNWVHGVVMVVMLFAVIAGVVMVTQAVRRIPVQYAKRQVGRKVMGGQSSYLPLKLNYSGVMPIIFASALTTFGITIFGQFGHWIGAQEGMRWLGDFFVGFGNLFNPSLSTWSYPWYYLIFGVLIFGFSYFWVSMMFKPQQIADDLKRHQGYVPGVRPGEPTAKYLDFIMTRLTLFGAIFLVVMALFPTLISNELSIPFTVAQFFGGTGLLIIVGVLLDFLRQIETYLLQRHYDGFLQKGRIKGRSKSRTRQTLSETVKSEEGQKLWRWLLAMFLSGLIAQAIYLFVS